MHNYYPHFRAEKQGLEKQLNNSPKVTWVKGVFNSHSSKDLKVTIWGTGKLISSIFWVKSRSKDRSWVEKSRIYWAFQEKDEGKEAKQGKESLDNITGWGSKCKLFNYRTKLPPNKKSVSKKMCINNLVMWGFDLIC